ncbi:MAG: outer membrane lipoprotein chaperone LolA [Thermodesulfobacteriota bacterium]
MSIAVPAALRAALAAALLLCPALAASARAERSSHDVVREVQERYDATQNFTADFTQEMRIEAGGQVIRSTGTMWFRKPGRMRWEYVTPEKQTIVADGETLWIDQPIDNQVLKAPLRQAFESRTPVSFLLGVARIERDFHATLLSPAEDGSLRLQLESNDSADGSLGSLILEVDPATYDVRAAVIRDPLNNTTRVVLADMKRNGTVDDDLFVYERRPGVDVIEAPSR